MGRTDIEREEQTGGDSEGGMSLNEFLNHKTTTSTNNYLPAWRKNGEIKVWLHRKAMFHAIWMHAWTRVVSIPDRETGEDRHMVFTKRFNCIDSFQQFVDVDGWEASGRPKHRIDDTLVKRARYRDEDTGKREHAPVACPYCLMLDWIGGEIVAKRMSWVEPLFKFEADDADQTVVLHAGGLLGMFGAQDLTKDEQAQMRKAGVSAKTAWREKAVVKCQYLFQVVQDADPSAGVVKALEAGDLGEKVQKALRKEMRTRGEKGNPQIHPYPLLWTYDENEKVFSKKYDVTVLHSERPSPTVLSKISGKPLDISDEIAPGNCILLRTELEAAALRDLPWDRFFGPAERLGLMDPDANRKAQSKPQSKPAPRAARDEDDEEDEEDDEPESAPPAKQIKPAGNGAKAETKTQAKTEQKKSEPSSVAGSACDFCAKPIGDDDLVCPHCGSTYDDDDENIVLDGVKCLDCGEIVPLADGEPHDGGTKHICPKCATIHTLVPNVKAFYEGGGSAEGLKFEWAAIERHPKKDEPKPAAARGRRGGRSAASTAEKSKQSDAAGMTEGDGDEMPW